MKKVIVLFVIFSTLLVQAQQKSIIISGKVVTADKDEPLIGVTVKEKGGQSGTITDLEGNFIFKTYNREIQLVCSMIGYETELIKGAANLKTIVIRMKEKSNELDDVVVIGYGSSKKSDLTGSVSSIKSEQITERKTTSLEEVLSGRIAGVQVTSSGGEPGAGLTIRVRGNSSVNADNEPLYVIDGFPIETSQTMVSAYNGKGNQTIDPLSNINPNDIQSIEVLKDASATAIYGSRGANGVVLITTKSGTKSAPKISFNSYLGFSEVTKRIPVLDKMKYADYYTRSNTPGLNPAISIATPNPDPAYPGEMMGVPVDFTDSIGIDWQNDIYRRAFQQNYNVSISGGTDATKYFGAYSYSNQEGTIPNSDFKTSGLRLKLDQKINSVLSAGVSANYSTILQNGTISSDGISGNSGIFQQLLLYRPTYKLRTNLDDIDAFETVQSVNPILYLKNMVKRNGSNRFQFNGYLKFDFNKKLNLNITYNTFNTNAKTQEYYSSKLILANSTNGQVTNAFAGVTMWSEENILTYKNKFGEHSITAMGAISLQENTQQRTVTTGFDLSNELLREESLPFAKDIQPVINDVSKYTMMSYIGRLEYGYKNRYLFTSSIRADGSSKFTKGNKFSYFPSAAFAWRAGEEQFLKNLKVFDNLKFRISYGRTGNSSIPPYSTASQYGSVYYPVEINGVTTLQYGLAPSNIGNNYLKWETTDQFDGGLDISVFNGRVSLTIDGYLRNTKDLLLTKSISFVNGGEKSIQNFGSLQNKGLEFGLSTINISNKNFTWTTDFNISFNENKVLDLGEVDSYPVDAPLHTSVYFNEFILAKGHSIGTMYGYVKEGIYQYADFNEFYNPDGSFISDLAQQRKIYTLKKYNKQPFTLRSGEPKRWGTVPEPGFVKFRDLNFDGDITSDKDRTYIGRSAPIFYGGLTNKFTFAGFDLSIFMQFSYGNNLFNANQHMFVNWTAVKNTTVDYYNNEWIPTRPTNIYPNSFDNLGVTASSSMQVFDASYLRCKDITFGYTIPSTVVKKIKISKFRIYISGQNLFVLTKYPWSDPEITFKDPLAAGYDRFSYPRSSTLLAGISIIF